MIAASDRDAALALLADYGWLVDAGRFDEWLALFGAECSYRVVPRENHALGLPAALMLCENRAMLEDRIASLLGANKYNIHTDRHLIGLPRLAAEGDGLTLEAAFMVVQSDQEGESRLFAAGTYHDRLERTPDGLRIRDKLVVLDSFAVPTLLATPL